MNTKEIMLELKELGSESIKKIFLKHGAVEPFFGVKVEYLKKIQKKVKKSHELSLSLYETGNSDAMYLAGLISVPQKMTKEKLEEWVEKAPWSMISEYTVPWVAAESKYGYELGKKWIDAKKEAIATAGWATLSSFISITPNEKIDLKEIESLMNRVQKEIHSAPNKVRYTMNGFIISVGSYIPDLTEKAKKIASAIGKVTVNMGETSCKVPDAKTYIEKVEKEGKIGKKRKTAMC